MDVRAGDYVRVDHRGVTRTGRVLSARDGRVEVRIVDDAGSSRVVNRAAKDVVVTSHANTRAANLASQMSEPGERLRRPPARDQEVKS